MANLTENPTWHDGIYQIERNDPVSGGKDGITNKPLKQLGDRTAFLKQEVDTAKSTLSHALTHTADNENYQAENKKIENIATPVNNNDATTKLYVDTADNNLQKQVNTLKENQLGYELVGDFKSGCTVSTRNEIVYDEQTKKYYSWVGRLPHVVAKDTIVTQEIKNGEPWLIIENSNELNAKIEGIKQIAKDVATRFYGFKKEGAKLILVTAGNADNDTLLVSEFLEWLIAPGGCEFTLTDKDLLMII